MLYENIHTKHIHEPSIHTYICMHLVQTKDESEIQHRCIRGCKNSQINMHAYVHGNMHTYIHTRNHAYTHTGKTYLSSRSAIQHICIRGCKNSQTNMHTYVHGNMHTYVHGNMHTYVHGNMHTHIQGTRTSPAGVPAYFV